MKARALPVALALYGLAVAFWPMFTSGFSLMEVDPADTRHLNYVLEHGHRWLTGNASLWSPAFFFPEANVGAYTEVLLGVLPFYSAWRVLGALPDTAFQLWMVTVALLNFVFAWALFRRALGFELLAAGTGAFLVSFGNLRLTELNHQHLLPHFFTFFAVHALVRVLKGSARSARWVLAFFAAVVLQLYASVTLGWFLCFGLAVAAAWALAFAPTRAELFRLLRAQAPAIAMGCLGAGLLLWPLLSPYAQAAHALGARDWGETALLAPQAQSWFFLGPHNWLMGWLAGNSLFTRLPSGGPRLGLGFVTTALVVATMWKTRREPWARVLTLAALTLVLTVTLYRGWVSPWQWVAKVVPGADGIRAIGRVGLVLLLPAGIGLAAFIEASRSRLLGVVLCAVVILEQGGRVPDTYPKQQLREDVARVAEAVDRKCRAFFYAPVGRPKFDEKTQLDAMWAQLATGVPTANGYSSHFPPEWDLLEHGLSPGEDSGPLRARLSRWEARHGLSPGSICFVGPPAVPAAVAEAEAGALFDDDVQHPWNRVHAALFSRPREIGVPPCSRAPEGCLSLSPAALHAVAFVSQRIEEGGDEPLAFIGGEVDFLANAARRDAALEAMKAALALEPASNPVAAVLLQNDLWERFDALNDALAEEQTPGKQFLAPLVEPLRQLVLHLALPREALGALPSNVDALAGAHPALIPGFPGPAWMEVRTEFTRRLSDSPWESGTRHAERWGHRVVFRVFARVPPEAGGAAWLRKELKPGLAFPAGSTLALVGAPLAVSREGALVPTKLVTLIELRGARAEAEVATTLGALSFDVLEGKRSLLRQSPPPSAGLLHLAPGTLIPLGATCMADRSSREPLKAACLTCHGVGATRLTGPLEHGQLRFVEETNPAAAGEAVAQVKAASPEFAKLRAAR